MTFSKCDVVYFVFSGIGIISGFSGFIIFLFAFGNVQAGIWVFFSGFYALATFFLFWLKLMNILDEWYGSSNLFRISILGCAGAMAIAIAAVCYVSYILVTKERFPTLETIKRSHYIMLVWSLMAFKWSVTTALVARIHGRRLRSGYEEL